HFGRGILPGHFDSYLGSVERIRQREHRRGDSSTGQRAEHDDPFSCPQYVSYRRRCMSARHWCSSLNPFSYKIGFACRHGCRIWTVLPPRDTCFAPLSISQMPDQRPYKILFAAYGGGHVAMTAPVAQAMSRL